MKKLFLIIFFLLILNYVLYASEVQRKISSGTLDSSTVVLAEHGTLYDLEIVATAAGGYATVFDSSDSDTSGDTEAAEAREATQYNSKHINFGVEGIKMHEGIFVYLNNATAIVHYR